jgi:hypothetical protein
VSMIDSDHNVRIVNLTTFINFNYKEVMICEVLMVMHIILLVIRFLTASSIHHGYTLSSDTTMCLSLSCSSSLTP